MASATDTRRRTGLRHEAVADFVDEYVFDALTSDGQPPADLGEALRLAFTEIIEASTSADWQRVGEDLVADARENLELERDSPACAPLPDVRLPRRTSRRYYYQPDGPRARARRETAGRLLDALEELREESPGQRVTLIQLATRANFAKETVFSQFGRMAGLHWAADARAATRLPALWAEAGFADPDLQHLEDRLLCGCCLGVAHRDSPLSELFLGLCGWTW
jgi:hypothetical protein